MHLTVQSKLGLKIRDQKNCYTWGGPGGEGGSRKSAKKESKIRTTSFVVDRETSIEEIVCL
jgi:hypothetical protein